jgi:hypothetical protein
MRHCPCGDELTSQADLAHGTCTDCRVTSKKRLRRSQPEQVDGPGLFEANPESRHLVPVDGWPDYRAQGAT